LYATLRRSAFLLDYASYLRSISLGDFDVTESWEWREGRLLAYELILKFLITNHIHYTFPAYTLTRSIQARSSKDQHRKSIDIHNKFSVSHNFGSKHSRGFSRHEPLSRSLTMESDPVTQRFVSSLVEKEKAKAQTFSLLELMRKSDKEIKNTAFDSLQADLMRSKFMKSIDISSSKCINIDLS